MHQPSQHPPALQQSATTSGGRVESQPSGAAGTKRSPGPSFRYRCRVFAYDAYLICKTNWALAPFLIAGWMLLPLQLVAALLLRLLRIRVLTNRRWPSSFHYVGHLAIELDGFFKDRVLGRNLEFRPWVIFPRDVSANPALLSLWSTKCRVISHPLAARLLRPLAHIPWCSYSLHRYISTIQWGVSPPDTFYRYRAQTPTLALTPSLTKLGDDFLRANGVPRDGWFICLHARTPGFHRSPQSDLRNVSIANYRKAIDFVVSQGGWVVRMGDPSMPPLPKLPHVIDYAHSTERSAALDLFLCASCRFFLGSASGPIAIATAFGIPLAVTNQAAPMLNDMLSVNDLYIPKIPVRIDGTTTVPIGIVLRENLHRARFTHCFDQSELTLRENSPEDILGLVKDLITPAHLSSSEIDRAATLRRHLEGMLHDVGLANRHCDRIAPSFLLTHEKDFFSMENVSVAKSQPLCGLECCPCLR
jgi:putative glycosyltransferase (TIGR04372 family)